MPTEAGRRTILAATSAVDVDVAATRRPVQPIPAVRRPPAARVLSPSLLLLILIGQACLSARLIWANTAFQDEALYLWAGRLELAHWLHGASIPAFPTYFSGAPVLYPPLGALANSLGGLAAARILSLLLMLGATALLWCTASMLFGRRAAFFSAALWAALGPTQQLGAFATFDALSLFLMAAAACCVVRAGQSRQATGWTLAAGAALMAANAATYSSLLFDPVILALAALTAQRQSGWATARSRITSLLAYLATAVAILVKLGGPWYLQGIAHTVLDRVSGSSPALAVLGQAWGWTGVIVVLSFAAVGIGLVCETGWQPRLILATLAVAAVLVPAEQARIGTLTSLNKHADVGAWFAAIAVGYAICRTISLLRLRVLQVMACLTCAAALYFPVMTGVAQADALSNWPNAAAFVTWLRPVADHRTGPMLIETPSVAEYYLPAGSQWKRWSSTFNITLPSGHVVEHSGQIGFPGHPQTYRKFIVRGYFSVIALDHGLASALDRVLIRYIERDHDYRLLAIVPYGKSGYSVWVRTAAR
jgi:4-amino-4-deoxy-L-arabinose transferase-like glycosyltransferase